MPRKKPTLPDFHFPELLKRCRRGGPAVTLPKDAGMVIAYTGIGRESRILELGTGSGFMTIQMANIAKEVVTYEKREEFAELAELNVKQSRLTNIILKQGDVLEGIEEKNESFELVFCDIAESNRITKRASELLYTGGFLAAHCLQIEQAKELVLEAKKYFKEVFMIENIVREYEVRDFGVRPQHFGLLHSAYLVFAKK
jgi:tRNA (adenine57-N1/adenine58-N1)-methyltransferase